MQATRIACLALLALCALHVAESQLTEGCVCTLEYAPVCAGGRTYGNACGAKCAGFLEDGWTQGECAKSPPRKITPPTCVCTLEYAPVCAEGKTYGNACGARCAKYKKGDWIQGECGKKCGCTREFRPVCAKGKIFNNPCLAKCNGYLKYTSGACAKSPKPCLCTKELRPVCFEGKTYGNRCMAKCAGAKKWSPYECGKCPCPRIRDPVCAKGKNFANPCTAKCFGYLKYTKGRCPCICPAIYAPVCVTAIRKTYENDCAAKCDGHARYTQGACEPPPITCAAGASTAKCSGATCETSESPCAKSPAVACLINPCSSATYLGTRLTKAQQCKPVYVNRATLKVVRNCNRPLPPTVCARGSPTARCKGDPCEVTKSPCKGDSRYVCVSNSCGRLTYLGTPLRNAMCTAIFVDPLTRKVAKACIVK